MLRRLLVPLDPSEFSTSAVKYACELAKDHEAEVTGLVMIDVPGIHQSVGPISPGSAHMAERAEYRREAEAHEDLMKVLADFQAVCDAAKLASRSIERLGDPSEIIGKEADFYDLLVMGLRTHFDFKTSDRPSQTLNKILGKLATPILAVPKTYKAFGTSLESIIAFDGSPASVRSMRQFAQNFFAKDLDIVLLTSTEKLEDANAICEPARDYLRAYDFDNIRLEWTPQDIKEVIDERYLDQVEVIVAGMHSKKGLFSFHVGSLTDHLVSEARIPVYIGQ